MLCEDVIKQLFGNKNCCNHPGVGTKHESNIQYSNKKHRISTRGIYFATSGAVANLTNLLDDKSGDKSGFGICCVSTEVLHVIKCSF